MTATVAPAHRTEKRKAAARSSQLASSPSTEFTLSKVPTAGRDRVEGLRTGRTLVDAVGRPAPLQSSLAQEIPCLADTSLAGKERYARLLAPLERYLHAGQGLPMLRITGIDLAEFSDLPEFLSALFALGEVHEATVSTSGRRIGKNPELARRLSRPGLRVEISFNGFSRESQLLLAGREFVYTKLRAIDELMAHGIAVELLMTVVRGVNLYETGDVARYALEYPGILGVEFLLDPGSPEQGGPSSRPVRAQELIEVLEEKTLRLVRAEDFAPLSQGSPPCCVKGQIGGTSLTALQLMTPSNYTVPPASTCSRYHLLVAGASSARPRRVNLVIRPNTQGDPSARPAPDGLTPEGTRRVGIGTRSGGKSGPWTSFLLLE